MANEKKRGFFSWLGFGQKEQAEEAQTESQQVTEQPVEEAPATEPAADSEKFAEEVVEVSEQLAHEEAQPEPSSKSWRFRLNTKNCRCRKMSQSRRSARKSGRRKLNRWWEKMRR